MNCRRRSPRVRRRGRHGEPQHCSADGAVLRPDAPVMRLDDRARNRQSESHAVRFGGEERVEQVRHLRFGNTAAEVHHRNFNATAAI